MSENKEQDILQYQEKLKKVDDILNTVNILLTLPIERGTNLEENYHKLDYLIGDYLKSKNISYSFTIMPIDGSKRKITSSGWQAANSIDLDLIVSNSAVNKPSLSLDRLNNIVFSLDVSDNEQKALLILKISSRSLEKYLGLLDPIITRDHDKDLVNIEPFRLNRIGVGFKEHRIHLGDHLIIRYDKPSFEILDAYLSNLKCNLLMLCVFYVVLLLASVVIYILLMHISRRFLQRKIFKQRYTIDTLTSELKKTEIICSQVSGELSALKVQINAEYEFLSKIKLFTKQASVSRDLVSLIFKGNCDTIEMGAQQVGAPMELDLGQAIKRTLSCFELTKHLHEIDVQIERTTISPIIRTSPAAVLLVLYNILQRIFTRAGPKGCISYELQANAGSAFLKIRDKGFCLGKDHSSYFTSTSSLSMLMLPWDKLVALVEGEGIVISSDVKQDHGYVETLIRFSHQEIETRNSENLKGSSNVVPLFN